MRYIKQFTAENVKTALIGTQGLMLAKLQEKIGCSEMTLRHLLKNMIASGEVVKTNIGASENKPVNIYFIPEKLFNGDKHEL